MYLPSDFEEADPAAIAALIDAAPLAAVVAQTPAALIANHLPLLRAPDGTLIGHIALANDLHRQIDDGQEVLAIFAGPSAYVSPNAYPSKAAHHRAVPTWNYEVAHVHGPIRFQHDEHSKRAAVALLTARQERRVNGAAGWRMADAPSDFLAQKLAAIVAFRITPERVLAKAKLSQNRDASDIAAVITDLEARGEHATAAAMRRRATLS